MAAKIPGSSTYVSEQTLFNANLVLKLVSIDSIDANVIKDAILDLGDVFLRYNEWKDTLSKNMHKAGAKIFEDLESICTPGNTIQMGIIQDFAKRHFSQLNNLLKNDLDKAPLKEPMLDGDWVWEKDILITSKGLSDISPFTQQPFAEKPHEFAAAVIKWVKSFTFVPVPSQNTDAVVQKPGLSPMTLGHLDLTLMQAPQNCPPQILEMMKQVQMLNFQQIALYRKNERTSWEIAERARELDRKTEQLIPMVRKRIQEGIEQAQRYAEALEKSLKEQVESYNQIRTQENQVLQSRLDTEQQRVEILDGKCDRLEQKVTEQAGKIAQKESEVAQLRSQLAYEINRANNSGGGCTIL